MKPLTKGKTVFTIDQNLCKIEWECRLIFCRKSVDDSNRYAKDTYNSTYPEYKKKEELEDMNYIETEEEANKELTKRLTKKETLHYKKGLKIRMTEGAEALMGNSLWEKGDIGIITGPNLEKKGFYVVQFKTQIRTDIEEHEFEPLTDNEIQKLNIKSLNEDSFYKLFKK